MQEEQYNNLKDLEFVIDKYYDQNLRGLVENKIKEVNKKRTAFDVKNTAFVTGIDGIARPVVTKVNPWNEFDSGQLLEYLYKNINQNDLSVFIQSAMPDLCFNSNGEELTSTACNYVVNRFRQCLVRQLAGHDISHSSAEFIAKNAFGGSLAGTLILKENPLYSGELSDDVTRKIKDIEKEKGFNTGFNKFVSQVLSWAIDSITIPGSLPSKGALSLVLNGGDVGLRTYMALKPDLNSTQQNYAYVLFHNKTLLDAIERKALSVTGRNTDYLNYINSYLVNKVDFSRFFITKVEYGQDRNIINNEIKNDKLRILSSVSSGLDFWNLKPDKSNQISERGHGWILSMSSDKCKNCATYYYSLAVQCRKKGMSVLKLNGKSLSINELAQLAYDYALAARSKYKDEKFSKKKIDFRNKILSEVKGNNKELRKKLKEEIRKLALKDIDDTVPSWMKHISSDNSRRYAAYYYGRLKAMEAQGNKAVRLKNGVTMTRSDIACRAAQYARHAVEKQKSEVKHAAITKTVSQNSSNILRRAKGNNTRFHSLLSGEMYRLGYRSFNKNVPSWMSKVSSDQCRRMSAKYLGILKSMKAHNQDEIFVGKTRMTQQQVAQQAWSYSKVAINRQKSEVKHAAIVKTVSQNSSSILRRAKGNNTRFHSLLSGEMYRLGYRRFNKNVPAWMSKVSSDQCRRMSAKYLGVLKSMKAHNQDEIFVGKTRMTQQQVAQQAWSYSKAASRNAENERKSRPAMIAKNKIINNDVHNALSKGYDNQQRSDSNAMRDRVYYRLNLFQIGYNRNANPPKWMTSQSEATCRKMASYYAELAIRQKNNGHKLYKNGQTFDYKQLAERAVQYANAACRLKNNRQQKTSSAFRAPMYIPQGQPAYSVPVAKNNNRRAKQADSMSPSQNRVNTRRNYAPEEYDTEEESSVSRKETYNESNYRQSQEGNGNGEYMAPLTEGYSQPAQQTVTNNQSGGFTYGQKPQNAPTDNPYAFLDNSSGWGKYLSDLNMSGFSDVFHNIGYVLAMLPDLLIGLFTGKLHINIKDNMLPLGMLLAGLFVNKKQNPLLRLLLMGGAGAMLLNKAGHKILNDRPAEKIARQEQQQNESHFKVYQDEPLNPRIQSPVIKGNLMLATIDGVPNVISISALPIEAYNKGTLPLNTLANAVLAKYDEQKQNISNEMNKQQQEQQQKAVSLK